MADTEGRWMYADNWRILLAFLAAADGILGLGILLVALEGASAAFGAGVLLSLGVFLAVFAIMLLVPRLTRWGVRSFRLYVDRTIDEVERDVRDALESSGFLVTVETAESRSAHPPRILGAQGLPWRFRLEAVSRREVRGGALARTEVIQIGLAAEDDADARSVREILAGRLALPRPEDS